MDERLDQMDERFDAMDKRLDNMDARFDILELRQSRTGKKLEDLQLDLKIFERNVRQDIHKRNDEMETVIEILKQHEMIPG
mgnify:CR=1 FL=1